MFLCKGAATAGDLHAWSLCPHRHSTLRVYNTAEEVVDIRGPSSDGLPVPVLSVCHASNVAQFLLAVTMKCSVMAGLFWPAQDVITPSVSDRWPQSSVCLGASLGNRATCVYVASI